MTVLAGEEVFDEVVRRLVDDEGLSWQGSFGDLPKGSEAALSGSQVVAVEQEQAIARDGLGAHDAERLDDRGEALVDVVNEGTLGDHLGVSELLVKCAQGSEQRVGDGEVSGAQAGLDLGDDDGHEVDERGEEKLALVLGLGGGAEELVEVAGGESELQEDARHPGEGGLVGKTLDDGAEKYEPTIARKR